MSDNLPGLSKDVGAGRPITPAEFRKRELEAATEVRADQLRSWIEGFECHCCEEISFPCYRCSALASDDKAARIRSAG